MAVLAACGAAESVCSELREPEDPQSGLHVIGDEVAYSSDPPTSGPHWAVDAPTGLQDAPLPLPLQVRVLESGGAVVQTADPAAMAELAPLATDWLVVAPGPDDLDALVMATAWTWRLECSAVDLDAITAFAEQRRQAAPGPD